MSDGKRIRAEKAYPIAKQMVDLLRPYCERIEIAGSLRRQQSDVGDVEIVCIPKTERSGDDSYHDVLDATNRMIDEGVIKKATIPLKNGGTTTRWGRKMRAFEYKGIKFDLFCCDEDNWGFIYWLRTGPGDANATLMTWLKRKRSPFLVEGGYIKYGGQTLAIASEEDWFTLLGFDWIQPQDRDAATYTRLFCDASHTWGDLSSVQSRQQLAMFDLGAFLEAQDTHSGLDTGVTVKQGQVDDSPAPSFGWESPWLVGSMVWLHTGYGIWQLFPMESGFAEIWQTVYASNPGKYQVDSKRLQSYLALNKKEVKIVGIAEQVVSALRGITV